MTAINMREALASYVKANRKEFEHDRSKTIGASEIAQCARKIWYAKHGIAPDADHIERWGALTRGNIIEILWVKAVRDAVGKGRLHYAGARQKTFFDPDYPLAATPDGLVSAYNNGIDHAYLVELKTLDPRTPMHAAKPEHVAQVTAQLGLVRLTSRYQPEYGLLTYIDASFLDEVRQFEVFYDDEVFQRLRARAKAIMEAGDADDLRPEGYIAGGGECQYCPYRHSCSAMRAGQVPGREARLADEDMAKVASWVFARARARQAVEVYTAQAREFEEDIKGVLRSAGTRRVEGFGVRVVWSSLKGRPAFDAAALREAAGRAGFDLAPFERVGEPSDRLQIKIDQEEGA